MANTVVTSAAINTPFLAAEYLMAQIGIEAAQIANVPESITVGYITDMSTLSAHFRNEVAITNPSAAAEATNNSGSLVGLPVVAWSPVGTVISAGLDGQSIVLSKVVNALTGDALESIAKQQGSALGRSVDSAILTLAPSLTATAVLGSGTLHVLTVGDILLANANLDAEHAEVAGGYQGRLHPHQFANLYQDILSKNFGIAKITLDSEGKEVINIGETILKKNTLVGNDASGLYWNGCVYSPQAMALAIAQNPMVEIIAIPSAHAFSIDGTIVFGVGVYRPKFGCLVQSAKTA